MLLSSDSQDFLSIAKFVDIKQNQKTQTGTQFNRANTKLLNICLQGTVQVFWIYQNELCVIPTFKGCILPYRGKKTDIQNLSAIFFFKGSNKDQLISGQLDQGRLHWGGSCWAWPWGITTSLITRATNHLWQESAHFSVRGQIVNISVFAGYSIMPLSVKAATDNT